MDSDRSSCSRSRSAGGEVDAASGAKDVVSPTLMKFLATTFEQLEGEERLKRRGDLCRTHQHVNVLLAIWKTLLLSWLAVFVEEQDVLACQD